MKILCKSTIKKSFIVAVILTLLLTGMSPEAWAASGAKKYTVKIHNASSNTVLKKGGKLKLKCSAVAKNGSRGKIKYKSSNRKIVTVSKKGVIKGKRKGKAKITVYVKQKGKIRGKKTITIRVGKRVSSIKLSGYN